MRVARANARARFRAGRGRVVGLGLWGEVLGDGQHGREAGVTCFCDRRLLGRPFARVIRRAGRMASRCGVLDDRVTEDGADLVWDRIDECVGRAQRREVLAEAIRCARSPPVNCGLGRLRCAFHRVESRRRQPRLCVSRTRVDSLWRDGLR